MCNSKSLANGSEGCQADSMKPLMLFFNLVLFGCSSLRGDKLRSPNSTPGGPIYLDASLLKDWNRDEKQVCRAPYRVVYQRGAWTLIYYSIGYEKIPMPLSGPALNGIKDEVLKWKPDEIITGATEARLQQMENGRQVKAQCVKEPQFFCGEPLYVSGLGYMLSTRVTGGEIGTAQLISALAQEKSVSRDDALAYVSAQMVIGFKTRGLAFGKWAEEFDRLKTDNPGYVQAGLWKLEDFERWLDNKMKASGGLRKIENDWIEPRLDKEASPLHRISSLATRVRDRFLLKTVQDSLNRNRTVLMVYSLGHQQSIDAPLTKALGLPQVTCLR